MVTGLIAEALIIQLFICDAVQCVEHNIMVLETKQEWPLHFSVVGEHVY